MLFFSKFKFQNRVRNKDKDINYKQKGNRETGTTRKN